jgi:cytochrome c
MSRRSSWLAAFAACWIPAYAGMTYPGVGRPATPAEIAAWDIDVRPDFKGLPPGKGSVADGQKVWDGKCASCHGTFGESNEVFTPLVGGITKEDLQTGRVASLKKPDQVRTSIMKLSTVSTLWDYIHRAMPWNAPKSLTTDEVYAVVAYLLNLGDVLPADFVLTDGNIAQVQARLPNRNGMTREHGLWDVKGRPDVANTACMKDCASDVKVGSQLPEHAKTSHGDLSQQNRDVGPARPQAVAADSHAPAAMPVTELARRKACLSCHGVDRKIVGPAFRDVAKRYKGQADAEARLLDKLRHGGSGNWGPLPMPPNPDLPASEATALVRWVLGL